MQDFRNLAPLDKGTQKERNVRQPYNKNKFVSQLKKASKVKYKFYFGLFNIPGFTFSDAILLSILIGKQEVSVKYCPYFKAKDLSLITGLKRDKIYKFLDKCKSKDIFDIYAPNIEGNLEIEYSIKKDFLHKYLYSYTGNAEWTYIYYDIIEQVNAVKSTLKEVYICSCMLFRLSYGYKCYQNFTDQSPFISTSGIPGVSERTMKRYRKKDLFKSLFNEEKSEYKNRIFYKINQK